MIQAINKIVALRDDKQKDSTLLSSMIAEYYLKHEQIQAMQTEQLELAKKITLEASRLELI
jgi:hypothetical protein